MILKHDTNQSWNHVFHSFHWYFWAWYKASNLFLSGVAFHQVRVNPMAREKWPGQAGCRGTADDWGWGIKPRIFMGISWEYHGVVRGCTSSKFFFSKQRYQDVHIVFFLITYGPYSSSHLTCLFWAIELPPPAIPALLSGTQHHLQLMIHSVRLGKVQNMVVQGYTECRSEESRLTTVHYCMGLACGTCLLLKSQQAWGAKGSAALFTNWNTRDPRKATHISLGVWTTSHFQRLLLPRWHVLNTA